MRLDHALLTLVVSCGVVACGGLDNPPLELPVVDFDYFVCAVQPVLDRECSTPACHGNPARGLQILSPSKMRIASEYASARAEIGVEEIELGLHPPLTDVELSFNYDQCRGFAESRRADERAQLLSRPLSPAAGGIYHDGTKGEVFADRDAAGYQTIERWLAGATTMECP